MVWSLANLGRADSHTHGGGFVCYLEEFHGTVHARSNKTPKRESKSSR